MSDPTSAFVVKSFHRRALPTPPAIPFSSSPGKQVFQSALEANHMDGYFALAEQFCTQAEPSFCGLSSLSIVLNALHLDPRRIWKGGWRYYSEHMLDCCTTLDTVLKEGVTLQQVACLAQCHGLQVEMTQPAEEPNRDLEAFRNAVKRATHWENDGEAYHLLVSYCRKTFLQSGDGHFSPIGGYCPEQDLVLVLDTARFKYPPHWVPLEMMWKSMQELDSVTGKPRGWLLLSVDKTPDATARSLYFVLMNHENDWTGMMQSLTEKIGEKKRRNSCGDCDCGSVEGKAEDSLEKTENILECFCAEVPDQLISSMSAHLKKLGVNYVPPEIKDQVNELKSQIHSTKLYKLTVDSINKEKFDSARFLESLDKEIAAEYLTMLLFSVNPQVWENVVGSESCPEFLKMMDLDSFESMPLLQNEIRALRRQMENMTRTACCSTPSKDQRCCSSGC